MTNTQISVNIVERSQQVADHLTQRQKHKLQSTDERTAQELDMTDMQPRIQIVGAGIAGLSLACHLRLKRIPFKIFDGASKPKGHNYGITIPSRAYESILAALDPPLSAEDFITNTAADRLIGGKGLVPSSGQQSQHDEKKIRVSDSALRNVLAQNHDIHWNHKITKTTSTENGLQLDFEDGSTSTAPITIDAGGERSGLLSHLLPDLDPTVLPYAVYHGSRYIPIEDLTTEYPNLFENDNTVREFTLPYQPPYPSTEPTKIYIQISKSYITHDQLPGPIRETYPTTSTNPSSTKFIELRYTISRPALSSTSSTSTKQDPTPDPIFNPNRNTKEAKTTPPEFYTELESLISQNQSQTQIQTILIPLLSPQEIKSNKDRLLNWLLRIKTPPLPSSSSSSSSSHLPQQLLLLGDTSQSLPILGSRGAEYAIIDAGEMAGFLELFLNDNDHGGQDMKSVDYYRGMEKVRKDRLTKAEEWLREVHRV